MMHYCSVNPMSEACPLANLCVPHKAEESKKYFGYAEKVKEGLNKFCPLKMAISKEALAIAVKTYEDMAPFFAYLPQTAKKPGWDELTKERPIKAL